jgi:putative DNA primase/helicase
VSANIIDIRPALKLAAEKALLPERTQYERNDRGNAQRLVALSGLDFRYCIETNEFHVWDGVRWEPDERYLKITQLLKEANKTIWGEVGQLSSSESQVSHAKWAVGSQNTDKLTAAIQNAKSEPGVAIRVAEFDADPLLLGVKNGVVDLKTGRFREARRDDLITRGAGCAYVRNAKCPRFRKFLKEMFPPDVVPYVKRAMGYFLTGLTTEQVFFCVLGVAAAGKSILLETIKALMGRYGANVRTEVLMTNARVSRGGPSEDEARLAGVRFASVNETSDGMRFNEALIKDLTGGDTITARKLHANSFEFVPQFKLALRGNHKPAFSGDDSGMARRIKLIWCSRAVPAKKRDYKLKEKLLNELPGILNFAIEGCREWQRGGLREPKSVSAATGEYVTDMDNLGTYIAEQCVLDERASTSVRTLYLKYKFSVEQKGQYPWSEKRFSQKLVERGHIRKRSKTGASLAGIRLHDSERDGDRDPPDEPAGHKAFRRLRRP